MIADLHESFETETAPIYDQAMRAHNRTHTPAPVAPGGSHPHGSASSTNHPSSTP